MSTIADVLAAHMFHNIEYEGIGGAWSIECNCDETVRGGSHIEAEAAFVSHQAQILAAAGIGDVREAKAQALEEAANGLGSDSDVSGTTIRSWLRARAFVIREGNA